MSLPTASQHGFELHGEVTPLRRLLRDLWGARGLVKALARRAFYTQYRRPSLGAIWSVAIPVIQAVVLSIVFTRIVRVQVEIPYTVFVLSGIIPWTFFSGTLGGAVRSITGNSGMASKVYFPRAVLPLSVVGSNVYGFIPTSVVLVVAAIVFRAPLGVNLLFLPLGVLAMVLLSSAFALVFAGLQVYFRDIAYILAAILQAWFYGSAVFFPVELIPEGLLRTLVLVNPATGMVEMFRVAFMGLHDYSLFALLCTFLWSIALLIGSAALYRRYDRVFVDLL